MTLYQLTHGTTSLAVGYGFTGIPLLMTLIARRASPKKFFYAPITAAVALIAAALLRCCGPGSGGFGDATAS